MATTTPPAGKVRAPEDRTADPPQPDEPRDDEEPQDERTRQGPVGEIPASRDPAWGARVVLAGLAATVITVGLAVLAFDAAADVVQVTAPAFAVITGLVAAYFGIRAGSLAAERVQGTAADKPPPVMSEKQQKQFLTNNPDLR